jgi:hypothetical protein
MFNMNFKHWSGKNKIKVCIAFSVNMWNEDTTEGITYVL